jgi:hypothetical protein
MATIFTWPHLARSGFATSGARANVDSLTTSPALPTVFRMPSKAFGRAVPFLGKFAHAAHMLDVERAPASVDADMVRRMLASWQSLKVASVVVERVLVLMVDVPPSGDRANLGLVDLDVERADAAVTPSLGRPVIDPMMPSRAIRVAREDETAIGDSLGSHIHILSS